MLKSLIPAGIKLKTRVALIKLGDLFIGIRFKFARSSSSQMRRGESFAEQITITQPINVSKWAENKKHNLRLAIKTFQSLPINPRQIYSFWHYVDQPSKKTGYKLGINTIKNKLDFDYGGGFCQLSGLLYHLALTAGLEIVERHSHSVDLYTDETRYTPLGADATTAYGYKDLRLRNNLNAPFCFRVEIRGNQFAGYICSPETLKAYELQFPKKMVGEKEEVETLRRNDSGEYESICRQVYDISDHNEVI